MNPRINNRSTIPTPKSPYLSGLGPLSAAALLTSVLSACAAGEGSSASAPDPSAAPPSPAEAAAEVEYQPAYPSDVSTEELSAADVEQQEATYSHGGEEHSHGDGSEHEQGEDGDHDHRGDGEHSH